MARRVFFSFHYDDMTRVNVVRNSDEIVRQYERAARFRDASLWEQAKKQGRLAIKRMMNGGLHATSVTCVLVGQHTWERPWVRYETLKSFARGNGIVAVQIHDVGFPPGHPNRELARLLANQVRSATQSWFGTLTSSFLERSKKRDSSWSLPVVATRRRWRGRCMAWSRIRRLIYMCFMIQPRSLSAACMRRQP